MVDLSSHTGYAGEDAPKAVFPSILSPIKDGINSVWDLEDNIRESDLREWMREWISLIVYWVLLVGKLSPNSSFLDSIQLLWSWLYPLLLCAMIIYIQTLQQRNKEPLTSQKQGKSDRRHGLKEGLTERVTEAEIIALVSDEVFQQEAAWKLLEILITCGTRGLTTATVKLADADGKEHCACSMGTGPIDSAYKAVDLIVREPTTLLEYSMNAVTEGTDAIATTRVLVRGNNNYTSTNAITGEEAQRTFSGTGAGRDMVVSGVEAYIGALNKMLDFKEKFLLETSNSLPE